MIKLFMTMELEKLYYLQLYQQSINFLINIRMLKFIYQAAQNQEPDYTELQ
jgi:hypothetical protein